MGPPDSNMVVVALVVAIFFLLALKLAPSIRGYSPRRTQADYFQLSGVPPPQPLPDFNIHEAKGRPYRPFRWVYHQTMGLKKLEPDYWLELESTYIERIVQRKKIYSKYGKTIIQMLPGSEPACKELMEMVIQWLCARYPNQFHYDPFTTSFHNQILGIESDVSAVEPLIFLLEHVPEDFILVQKDLKTGLHILKAGIICSAVGWDLSEKIGKPLHEVHQPVPDYKKLEFSMERFFSKLSCDRPIQRGSWTFEIGQPLFVPVGDPHLSSRDKQRNDLKLEDIHLRVDWQTLRRLPVSQAICFNYKALFSPVTDFRNEPYIPKLVSKVIREGNKDIIEYKSTYHIEHVMLPALDTWSIEQEGKGWVPKGWEVRTLDEDPFFPGWEKP